MKIKQIYCEIYYGWYRILKIVRGVTPEEGAYSLLTGVMVFNFATIAFLSETFIFHTRGVRSESLSMPYLLSYLAISIAAQALIFKKNGVFKEIIRQYDARPELLTDIFIIRMNINHPRIIGTSLVSASE